MGTQVQVTNSMHLAEFNPTLSLPVQIHNVLRTNNSGKIVPMTYPLMNIFNISNVLKN